MKHAVIMTGGKQYRVAENDVIYVEKLNVADGETVTFDQVLAVVDEAQEKLPSHAGPSSALHEGRDHRDQRLIRTI